MDGLYTRLAAETANYSIGKHQQGSDGRSLSATWWQGRKDPLCLCHFDAVSIPDIGPTGLWIPILAFASITQEPRATPPPVVCRWDFDWGKPGVQLLWSQ